MTSNNPEETLRDEAVREAFDIIVRECRLVMPDESGFAAHAAEAIVTRFYAPPEAKPRREQVGICPECRMMRVAGQCVNGCAPEPGIISREKDQGVTRLAEVLDFVRRCRESSADRSLDTSAAAVVESGLIEALEALTGKYVP